MKDFGLRPLQMGANTWGPMSGLGDGLGGGFSGLGGGGIDFSQIMSLLSGMSSYTSPASTTQSTQLTPKQIEKEKVKAEEKAEEKVEAAQAEVKKEEEKLTEKEDAKKAEIGKEYGWGDWLKSVGKGALGIVTDAVCNKDEKGERHLSLTKCLTTGAVVAAGVAVAAVAASSIVVAGVALAPIAGAALTVATVGGGLLSAAQIGKGIADKSNAETFAAKDAAVQEITEGFVGGALSIIGFKGAGALKGAKVAKAAESLTSATEGLTAVATDAGKTSAASALLKAEGLSENAELVNLVADAKKAGKPIGFLDLHKAGIVDGSQKVKLQHAINAALKEADIIQVNPKDTALIEAISQEADLLQKAGKDTKAAENATEALRDLLNLTSKDGISPELEAALAKIKTGSPEATKALGLGTKSSTTVTTVNNLAGREVRILKGLKGIADASADEEVIIKNAITSLENLSKKGADINELKDILKALKGCKSVDGELEIAITSALKSLKVSFGQNIIAAGKSTARGVVSTPRTMGRITKQVVTHPFKERKEAGLTAFRTAIIPPQSSNILSEAQRQLLQEARIATLDKETKKQKDALEVATNKKTTAVRESAKLHGIDLKEGTEMKSVEKLQEEIAADITAKKEAKEALAAAEKEKAAKAAAYC